MDGNGREDLHWQLLDLCSEPHGHQEASSESWPCPIKPHVHLYISPTVCETVENALLTLDLICRIKMLQDTIP